jgi:TetR/AcrR family transcriptional repressor of nem operon
MGEPEPLQCAGLRRLRGGSRLTGLRGRLYGRISGAMQRQTVRPARSATARERLLSVGLGQARRAGLRSITVRGVCQQADANLGSFVYHFGSRDAFVAEVIERWYGPLLERMNAAVDRALPPADRLRTLVLQLADWAAANSRFITHVLMDASAGEAAAQQFVRSLAGRHPALILRVLGEAQRAGALPRGEPMNMLLFLMGAIALPILLVERLAGVRLAPAGLARTLAAFAREREYRVQRLDWALAGLTREVRHGKKPTRR